jgi:hypothetical protein
MILLRQLAMLADTAPSWSRRNIADIGLARCARCDRAFGFASSWQGGFSHPPFAIPPVQELRPVYPGGRAFVPSQPHQSRAFRPCTLTRGLAPATRVSGVPPSPTLPTPARIGCAPYREFSR